MKIDFNDVYLKAKKIKKIEKKVSKTVACLIFLHGEESKKLTSHRAEYILKQIKRFYAS